MKKSLYLIRHAHRDKDFGRETDNGLSDKGFDQAKALAKHFSKKDLEGALFFTSPKKRCRQTLEAVAERAEAEVVIEHALDEGGDLSKKIKNFMQLVDHSKAESIFACSHGDWIPDALLILCGAQASLKKGAMAELVSEEAGKWKLRQLVQEF